MLYDKPKVTIDLDEYLELKKTSEEFSKDKIVLAAKKAVAAMMNNRADLPKTWDELKRDGVLLKVTDINKFRFTHEDVILEIIKQKTDN